MIGLDIVTAGWDHPGWERDFYPDDLPADWRLTYFANEFPAVMIAAVRWLPADESLLGSWREDVPDGFRFYLEVPGAVEAPPDLDLAHRVLGEQLAGLVQDAGTAGSLPSDLAPRFEVLNGPEGLPGADCLPAWRVPGTHVRDLRAGRDWLERVAAQAPGGSGLLLFADGDAGIEDLRRWWHLVRLLGLA